jgi:hypothetical protein
MHLPGLVSLEISGPLASTAARGQGYNHGLVAVLDHPDTVAVYAKHPAHLEVHNMREGICEAEFDGKAGTLAYDLVF